MIAVRRTATQWDGTDLDQVFIQHPSGSGFNSGAGTSLNGVDAAPAINLDAGVIGNVDSVTLASHDGTRANIEHHQPL